jgi:hypothetical protein
MATLVVGYDDGTLALWHRADGKQLARTRLHGPVRHLLVESGVLYAATDLGDWLAWDLHALTADRCTMLREVWARLPVVWESGAAVVREPPAGHPCR